MRVTKLTLGPHDNNVYIVACERTGESIVIDASFDAESIVAATAGTQVRAILLTHGDFDHIDALAELKAQLGVPVGIHAADAERLDTPPDFLLSESEPFTVGDGALRIIHTPGHTAGSICLHFDDTLIR